MGGQNEEAGGGGVPRAGPSDDVVFNSLWPLVLPRSRELDKPQRAGAARDLPRGRILPVCDYPNNCVFPKSVPVRLRSDMQNGGCETSIPKNVTNPKRVVTSVYC